MPASIPKVDLGTTGLSVSELALGCARLPFGGSEAEVDGARATVLRSLELGINLIDVSPLYGAGDVEPALGPALQGVPREKYVLSTKTGYVMTQRVVWERKHLDRSRRRPVPQDFSYDFTMRSIEQSLRALRQERIEIVHFHAPSSEQVPTIVQGAFRALAELRTQGVIDAIGAGMTDLAAAVELLAAVDLDCIILAVFYNLLLHTGAQELLPRCLEKGVPVLVAGPYGSGLLADPYAAQPRFGYRPAEREWIDKAQQVDALGRQSGVPLKAAAMQFPLAHPAVVSIITGPANPRELEENVQMRTSAVSSEFWALLRANGLLPEGIPTPG